MSSICKTLRIERKAKRITLKQLAERVQSTDAYLSTIETGKQNPTIGIVEKIAEELGLELRLQKKGVTF